MSAEIVPKASFSADPRVEYADADVVGTSLVVRPWADGDWFIPLGMTEKKKLSDFFVDEKVPLFEKRMVPLLLAGEDIIWVCGKRLDERFKVTEKTRSIVKLTYTPTR